MHNFTNQLTCINCEANPNPIFFCESVYEQFTNKNKTDYNTNELIVQQKINNDKSDTICKNINCNEVQEDEFSEENRKQHGQCRCKDFIEKLKDILGNPSSDEPNDGTNPLKNKSHEDIFYNLPIDLMSDDCGEDLKSFELDGEYYLKKYTEILKCYDLNSEGDEFSKKTELVEDNTCSELNNLLEKPEEFKSNPTNYKDTTENDVKSKAAGINNNDDHIKIKKENAKRRVCVKKIRRKKKPLPFQNTLYYDKNLVICNQIQENKKKGNNKTYVYTYGESYRGGIIYGHKKCLDTHLSNESWKNKQTDEETEERINTLNEEVKMLNARYNRSNSVISSNKFNNSADEGKIIDDMATKYNKSMLEVKKSNGLYTITMNPMVLDKKSVTEEPVVFKLDSLRNTVDPMNSNSNLDFEVGPAVMMPKQSRSTIKGRIAQMQYNKAHFQSTEEIKEKNDMATGGNKSLLEVKKTDGLYTITMNPMVLDKKSVTEEPVVFKLDTLRNTVNPTNSDSNFEFEVGPSVRKPKSLRSRNKGSTAQMQYNKAHFQSDKEV